MCATTFSAFILHFSSGTVAWIQSFQSDWPRMVSSDGLGGYWIDVLAPASQCALLLLAAMIGLFEAVWVGRRMVAWFAIVTFGATSALAVDAMFCRYQYSVDVATAEYWAGGGFAHVYYTWWWYNNKWLGVPWYQDAGISIIALD